MRKILLIFASIIQCGVAAQAQGDAKSIVGELYSTMSEFNPYRVEIEVQYDNNSISGVYEVNKDNYYISIGGSKLFGDSHEKYEVFEDRKEVVIDVVTEDYNGNILNNPATAFKAIKDYYDATLISEDKESATLELKQHIDDSAMESIELIVSKTTKQPVEITYIYDGEVVIIKVLAISRLASSITSFNPSNYTNYEIIDFR